MKEELLRLADRCEAAAGPDRELDIAIAVAIDWRESDWEEGEATAREMAEKHGLARLVSRSVEGFNSVWRYLPRYTDSLDTAMTLVPEGWGAVVDWRTQPICASVETETVDNDTFEPEKAQSLCSVTPALALCAASLRAQASVKEQNNGK